MIATTGTPKLQVGETAVLEVKDVAKIGAFLDMGLEKDLLLPFNDKARPETILREMKMSKNAFKRAVGRLLKEGKIRITEKTIERI